MKFLTFLLIFLNFSFFAKAQSAKYRAEVRKVGTDDTLPMFNIFLESEIKGPNLFLKADFKSSDGAVAISESAIMKYDDADLLDYQVIQNQTKEKGFVKVENNKITIKYQVDGKPEVVKVLDKPKYLVAPGNFERWLDVHLAQLKNEGSMRVDFLVWNKLDTYGFKVTYMGPETINGVKTEGFKMNIDNMFLAAILNPIKIWKTLDMKQMIKYKGRVAVKQVLGRELQNLDAEVMYFHDLKAAQ